MRKRIESVVPAAAFFVALGTVGCMAPVPTAPPRMPALEYSQHVRGASSNSRYPTPQAATSARAQFRSPVFASEGDLTGQPAPLHFVKDLPPEERGGEVVTNLDAPPSPGLADDVQVYRSERDRLQPDYRSPLGLGDPGVSASLWQESRAANDLFRDYRAFQPMDLVTILVTEVSEGKKEADTEVESESNILLGIANFFNFERDAENRNPGLDTSTLVNASAESSFESEGETTRKGSLKGIISAMVVEVLPSGILRVEGEKIISVNSEEQIMVVSGLVRQRDINARNEVDSSKIANLRIDYFGRGTVGDAQHGGWMSRLLRRFWPF